MARFRRGDLILNSNKKAKIGDAEISDNGDQLEINKPLKTNGIQLATGEEITSTSSSVATDSTSSLIPSNTVRAKMTQASSGLGDSVDSVGAIINPREDIKGSQLVYGATGVEYETDFSLYTDSQIIAIHSNSVTAGFAVTTLGYAAHYSFYNAGKSARVVYIDIVDQTTVNEITLITGGAIGAFPTDKLSGALPNGGSVSGIQDYDTLKTYLAFTNADCSVAILKEIPFFSYSYEYQYCILPNNDVVVVFSPDDTSLYWTKYRADFDSSTVITVNEPEDTGYSFSETNFSPGNFGRYLGSNKVAFAIDSGIVVLDLGTGQISTQASILGSSNTFSTFEFTTDRRFVVFSPFIDSSTSILSSVFTEDGELLYSGEHAINEYTGVLDSIGHTILLPNGNVMLIYTANDPNSENYSFGILILDSNGTEISSIIYDLGGGTVNPTIEMAIASSGFFVYTYHNGSDNLIKTLTSPSLKVTSSLSISGTIYDISSDIYGDNQIVTADAIQDTRKYKNFINQNNWSPYITLPGKVDSRELGDKWIGRYSNPFVTSGTTATYLASNVFPGTNKAILFYRKSATEPKYVIVNIDTNEYTEYDLNLPAGETDAYPFYCYMTKSGIALGIFQNNDSWIEAVNSNGESVAFQNVISDTISGFMVLNNDRILIRNDRSGVNYIAQFTVDIDSSSFIQVTDWEIGDSWSGNIGPYKMYDMGNGEILAPHEGSYIIKMDIHGNELSNYALNTGGYITQSKTVFANNLICTFGNNTSDYVPKLVIQDRDFNIIKQEVIDNPDSLSAARILYSAACVLGNGTIVFPFTTTSPYNSYLYILEPDLTGRFVKLINSSLLYNITGLQLHPYKDGFVAIGNHSNRTATVLTFEREPKDESINSTSTTVRANSGAYGTIPIKYEKRNIYSNISADNQQKNIGIFPDGRIVLFENVSSDMVYSILEADGTIVVDRQSLFLGYDYTAGSNTRIENDKRPSVFSFKDRNWVLATFKDNSTYERVSIVIDSEGNQPCYPRYYGTTGSSGCSTYLLDNGNIVIAEYDSAGVQGSGTYLGMWKADTDSSSIVTIINPFRVTESYTSGTFYQISKNRMVWFGSELQVLSTRTLGIVDRYASPYSGRSVGDRVILVTPNNKIIFTCWTQIVISQKYDIYARIFSFDSYSDKVTYDQEVFLYKTQSFYTPATMVWDDNGYILFHGINFNHQEPRASHRANGILMMDEVGNKLNPDDYINYDDGYYTTWGILNKGSDGALYVVKNEVTGTYTQIDRWAPVTKKDSPLRTNEYVYEYTYDGTTSLTLSMVNLGQTITNNDPTAEIIVPSDSSDDLPIGFYCKVVRLSGSVTFTTDGVTATITSADSNLSLRTTGSTAKIIKVAADTWLLTGDLA